MKSLVFGIFLALLCVLQYCQARPKVIIEDIVANHRHKSNEKGLNPVISSDATKFKTSLRTVSNSVSLTNTYVNEKGFYEIAVYGKISSSGKCQFPVAKFIYAIDICATTDNQPGYWVVDYVYADPTGNTYYEYEQLFSDSSCSTPSQDPVYTSNEYILICQGNNVYGWTLYHTRQQLLDPLYDNLGFTWLTYDSSSDCLANNYAVGALEALYLRLNACYPATNGGGDIKYTSCDQSTGLTIVNYYSTDGSCSGTSETVVMTSADTCTDGSSSLGYYLGWFNFVCSTDPI
jgi:hypothetical protein